MTEEGDKKTSGTVASRTCPVCGHHEIGFTTEDGQFHPLKPGTLIQVLEGPEIVPPSVRPGRIQQDLEVADKPVYRAWLPEPLRSERELRLKYGVMVKERSLTSGMSGAVYQIAYLEKLQNLIEKEEDIPIPISLDRFFTAPHLASGNAAEIAEAMWRELDEIRRPVWLMTAWLEKQDQASFAELVAPKPSKALSDEPAGDQELAKELEALTFEEFLGLL
jgi:hypothetical protein